MYTTNGKAIFDEIAIHRAARELRAKAFAELVGKAGRGIKSLVLRTIVDPIRARARRERQLEELMGMDDHMLRDLGLSRGGIAYAFDHGRDGEFAGAEAANANAPLAKPRAA
jgi:uncharacterized protein YjiS (DUF1127 family)